MRSGDSTSAVTADEAGSYLSTCVDPGSCSRALLSARNETIVGAAEMLVAG